MLNLYLYYVLSTGTRLKNIPKDLVRTDENKVFAEADVKSLDKTPHNLEYNELPRKQLSLKMNSVKSYKAHEEKEAAWESENNTTHTFHIARKDDTKF